MDILTTKIIAIIIISIISFIFGMLPLAARRLLMNLRHAETIISSCLCFGGGVLMATVFLHLFVEVNENVEIAMGNNYIVKTHFPIGNLLLCSGFFFVYLLEELVHFWVHQNHQKHSNSKRCRKISTTESIDRCESHNAVAVLVGCEGSCSSECRSELPTPDVVNVDKINRDSIVDFNKANQKIKPIFTISDQDEHVNFSQKTVVISEPDYISVTDSVNDLNVKMSSMRSILVIIALSLHGIFEGIALGLESHINDIWLLCAALIMHKIFIGFSIGMELLEVGIKLTRFILYMLIFSLASPIGSSIGIIAEESAGSASPGGQLAVTLLQGLSGGTILYVTFCEVLERERSKSTGRFFKFIALLCGFILIAILQLYLGDEHD